MLMTEWPARKIALPESAANARALGVFVMARVNV